MSQNRLALLASDRVCESVDGDTIDTIGTIDGFLLDSDESYINWNSIPRCVLDHHTRTLVNLALFSKAAECRFSSFILSTTEEEKDIMIKNLNECQCCDTHMKRRPDSYKPSYYPTTRWDESKWTRNCDCMCRHLSREICTYHPDNRLFQSFIGLLVRLADETKDQRFLRLQYDDELWTEVKHQCWELRYSIDSMAGSCCKKVELKFGWVDVMDTMKVLFKKFGSDIGNTIGSFIFWDHPLNKEYIEKRAPWTWGWVSRIEARFYAYTRNFSFRYNWDWQEDKKKIEEIKKLFIRRMNCCDYNFSQSCQHCSKIDYELKERGNKIMMEEARKSLVQRSKEAIKELEDPYPINPRPSHIYYREQINEYGKSEMKLWVNCGLLEHDPKCDHCKEDGPFPEAEKKHKSYCYYRISRQNLLDIYREIERKYPHDPRFDPYVYCKGDHWCD